MPAAAVRSASRSTARSRPTLTVGALGALGLVALVVLSACSSGTSTGTAAGAATPTAAPSGSGADGTRPGGPAASGLIAAADGSTLQVQSRQDGQVAVTWTGTTTFTQQVAVTAGSLAAGDCVTAVSSSGTATSTAFTATSVRVTAAVDGSCGNGFGGGGPGERPSGAPTGDASGGRFPSGGARPSGAPTGSGTTRTGAVASGQVVSVAGSTLVVAAREFDRSAGSTPATVDETVTLDASTTVSEQQAATSAAATVGRCVTAEGTADSSGAVTATSIAVTDAVDGACTGGFGGFGGRPHASATTSGTTGG